MAKTIIGMFDNFSDAQDTVRDLESEGFERRNISLIAKQRDNTGGTTATTSDTGDTGAGIAAGAATGAVVGGLAGLLAAVAIPGVGPVLAMGPLAATLTGAGVGAVAGGLIGGLVNAGVPEEEAYTYEEGVRRGGILVAVATEESRTDRVLEIMNRHNPIDIDQRAEEWRRSGWTGRSAAAGTARTDTKTARHPKQGEEAIPVVEEELQVGKRQVQRGGVRIYSEIKERPVEETVHLREENVKVERRPVDRPASDADFDKFREGTIEVTETREEPVVRKQARVTEEVVVNKDVRERDETVRDTVRATEVHVDEGSGTTAGATRGAGYETYATDFRSNFQSSYPGNNYDDWEPAYRYGYDLANDRSAAGRDWQAVEPDARVRWEERNPGTWDRAKDSIRYAYDRVRGGGTVRR
jgi:uncharacterized protein (TIGR02271 family)